MKPLFKIVLLLVAFTLIGIPAAAQEREKLTTKEKLEQLSSIRLITYNEWIDLGLYLRENYPNDAVLKNYYRKLSRNYVQIAELNDGKEKTTVLRSTQSMTSGEDLLRSTGWKD